VIAAIPAERTSMARWPVARHGNDGWRYHRWNRALTSGGEAVAKLERFTTAIDSAISRTICTANTTKIAGQLIRSYSGLKSSGLGIDASPFRIKRRNSPTTNLTM
jgi:hypothetical protein